ncbi:hypothetical protein [Flavivirga sp. 57AJ16]|uniref:hypothetical protein n=1 Tax=Flavivirga sp. 57AJ16 TaxID=3025307 RepID=UPI002366E2FB|nr:hypothetical protein [Flavivirga sp. 57AJ16]MDD7887863.1 hypothetical protein [Flavivirga sp. 57AJ16]
MSTKPDDLDLEVIYEIAQRSQEVQDLIEEKNKAISSIDKSRFATYQKPNLTLKPKGDIALNQNYKKEIASKETANKLKAETKEQYDKKIKDEMLNKAKSADYANHTINQIADMPHQDLAILSEKDVGGYKKHQQELEKSEPEKLDIKMSDEKSKEFFGNLETKQKNTSLEEKEIEQHNKTEPTIQMDENTSHEFFDRQIAFKENSKDIVTDKNKTPSPSDDFE